LDDNEITIQIDDCFKYGFDGKKFNYTIKEKGILDADDKRGNLIIHFLLSKDENFDEKLLRFFS
jgi:hypothetical protein